MKKHLFLLTFLLLGTSLFAQINDRFFNGIKNDQLDVVKKCLRDNRFLLNTMDEDGATPLMWAVYKGSLPMVKYLIDSCGAGNNLRPKGVIYIDSLKESYYGNISSIAAGNNKVDILRYFIEEKGWDWMKADKEYNPITKKYDGWTALEWASSAGATKSVMYLAQIGADISVNNGSCLRYAYLNEHSIISYYFMEKGIQIPVPTNPDEMHIIHHAANYGDQYMTLLLLERGVDINTWHKHPIYNALYYAIRREMLYKEIKINPFTGEEISAEAAKNLTEMWNATDHIKISFRNQLLMKGATFPPISQLPDSLQKDPQLSELLNYAERTKSVNPRDSYWQNLADDASYDSDPEGTCYFLNKIQLAKPDNSTFFTFDDLDVKKIYANLRSGKKSEATAILSKKHEFLLNLPVTDSLELVENLSLLGNLYLVNNEFYKSGDLYERAITIFKRQHHIAPDSISPPDSLGRKKIGDLYFKYSICLANQGKYLESIGQYFKFLTAINFENDEYHDQHLKLLSIATQNDGLLSAIIRTTNVFLKRPGVEVDVWSQSGRYHDTDSDEPGSDENIVYNAASVFQSDTLSALALTYAWLEKAKSLRLFSWLSDEGSVFFEPNFFQNLTIERNLRLKYKLGSQLEHASYVNSLSAQFAWVLSFKTEEISKKYNQPVLFPHQMSSHLDTDECILEFVCFTLPFSNIKQISVLVYKKSMTAPIMINLCTQTNLDSILNNADPNDLYSTNSPLYELLWSPLEHLTKGINKICLSPDGPLFHVNFSAIALPNGSALMDQYQLITLISTRDLVNRFKTRPETKPQKIVTFGGIDYDALPNIPKITCQLPDSFSVKAHVQTNDQDCYLSKGKRYLANQWHYLDCSKNEVIQIGNTALNGGLKVWQYTGSNASEENFKAIGEIYCDGISQPDVIIVSTHGYAFPPPRDGTRVTNKYETLHDPMYRSGLVMAGGNKAWLSGKPFPDREDGILLAEEIAQLDLRGVKLVVLSACETGLGDNTGTQGIFGLIRAFKLAGVEKVVVSLWKVGDQSSSEFTNRLFKKWLGGQTSLREALISTQKELRSSKNFSDPKDWASFILVE